MNKTLIIFLLIATAVGISSCETYGDDIKQEFSSIHPMSGEWVILSQKDQTGTELIIGIDKNGKNIYAIGSILRTYNTSDNSTTMMWIAHTIDDFGFKVKTDVNVAGKTFGNADNRKSTFAATVGNYYSYTINEGVVTTDGYDTPTGHKADLLVLKYTSIDNPKVVGNVYTIKAFRQTGWTEDLP